MYDIVLHSGVEHSNIWWIVITSLLSLLAGIGIGKFSGRIGVLAGLLETHPPE